MQDNEQFMSSEGLAHAEDSTQWDVLVSQGVGSESISKWDRESLFIKFDPLVYGGREVKKKISEQAPQDNCEISENLGFLENLDTSEKHELVDKPEVLIKQRFSDELLSVNDISSGIEQLPEDNVQIKHELFENNETFVVGLLLDKLSLEEPMPEAQLIKPKEEHVFAIPKAIIPKLVPIETPPSNKGFCVPITPVPFRAEEDFNVAPPGVEPNLSELGVPNAESPPPVDEMPPSLSNYNQINGSNKEAMIQEVLSAQKEQFLNQLADKDKRIQELLDAKLKEETAMVDQDKNTSRVLVEYEKTMSSYVEQIEELKTKLARAQVERLDAQKERDQALEDLKHVEDAFSLLHQKYERVKGTLENFRKNEEILKLRDQEITLKLENRDKKIESMKEESTNNMALMCQDFEAKYSALQSDNLKLRAMLRKNEMAVETLGQNLEQKQKENIELNKLCEELIGGGLNVK